MSKITVADLRRSVAYVNQDNSKARNLKDLSDEEFLKCDFIRDLGLGHVKLSDMVIDLRRHYNVDLPLEIFKVVADNTVHSFLDAINICLEDANET